MSTRDQTTDRRLGHGSAPPALGLTCVALTLIVALGGLVIARFGLRHGLLYALGLGFGITLSQSRFSFSAAFRQTVEHGRGRDVRAHLLLLAATSVAFALILARAPRVFGVRPHGLVDPLGVSVAVGAVLFGVGMQLGGACMGGTLYDVGSGYVALLLTLAGYLGGTVLGAWHWRFWTHDLPSLPPLSLAQGPWGYGGALAAQLAALGLLALATVVLTRRHPRPHRPHEPAAQRRRGIGRLRDPWPLWVGALLLAALNALTLLVKGAPWGITSAFTLAGSQLGGVLGLPVASWAYWRGPRAATLHAPLLADATVVMDAGIVLGALLAAALAGTFALRRPVALPTAVAALVGGLLMGYGSLLAYGCTVGGYLGGIASFSLHGWLWTGMALLGVYGGGRLIALLGLPALRIQRPNR